MSIGVGCIRQFMENVAFEIDHLKGGGKLIRAIDTVHAVFRWQRVEQVSIVHGNRHTMMSALQTDNLNNCIGAGSQQGLINDMNGGVSWGFSIIGTVAKDGNLPVVTHLI